MYSAAYVWTVKNELNHLPTYFHGPKTGNKPSSSPQKNKNKNKNLYLTSGEKSVNTKQLFKRYFTYPKIIK